LLSEDPKRTDGVEEGSAFFTARRIGGAVIMMFLASVGTVAVLKGHTAAKPMKNTLLGATAPEHETTTLPWKEGTEPFEYQTEYTLGRNISAIKCNQYDDDNIESVEVCGTMDIFQCEEVVKDKSGGGYSNFFSNCPSACSETNMAANTTWAFVCGVEAVKNWRDTCGGSFTATLPTWSSNNNAPDKMTRAERSNPDFDACHEHAWCYACEAENSFCNFFEDLYDMAEDLSVISLFADATYAFFCHDDVVDAIEHGDFWDKQASGAFAKHLEGKQLELLINPPRTR
jgi:hypothetical protein